MPSERLFSPDGVVDLDDGVGVADGASVRGVEVGHVLRPGLDGLHAAKLVLGLLVRDPGKGNINVKTEPYILSLIR